MSETELQYLDLIVFSNYENRNDLLAVMKIAYEAGQREENDFIPEDRTFDKWIADIKHQLDK